MIPLFPPFAPDKIRGQAPLARRKCTLAQIKKFREILEKAGDEKPLQQFLEENPVMLLLGLVAPHSAWVFPRPRLPRPDGGGWVPDFMICDWTSIGPRWTIVELESPRQKALTKAGSATAMCNHAREQLEDYRRHLKKNAAQLRDGGWPIDGGKTAGWIVIGRRFDGRAESGEDRLSNLRDYNIEVASYDRLVEECEFYVKSEKASKASLRRLLKQVELSKRRATKKVIPRPPTKS